MVDMLFLLVVFAFSFLLGHVLICRVPALLHTPLMSMTNAMSAVTILGALLLFATETRTMGIVLGAMAVAMATFNLAGGFAITHRMLRLFKRNRQGPRTAAGEASQCRPSPDAQDISPGT